LELLTNRYCCF